MIQALRISLDSDRVKDDGDKQAIATWVKSYDKLLLQFGVEPVTWTSDEEDGKMIFSAWIPPDCLPEFNKAATFLSEAFRDNGFECQDEPRTI